jgi:NAD-dependent dihydropyrimidine dehydrogenase PreA subunit/flavodoxin
MPGEHSASKPYHIYWFSGSGNSLLIAIEIRDCLRQHGFAADLFPMENTDPATIDTSAIVGFVVPVAGQGTYPLVWDFLEGLPDAAGTPCFLVDTLGLYSGGILGPAKKIVMRKGYVPVAAKEIRMPNIFMKMKYSPKKENTLVDNGMVRAREFCEQLINGRGSWRDIPIYSSFMSVFYRSKRLMGVYRKIFPLAIDPAKCKRCGLCVRLCPVNNLKVNGLNVPMRGDTCILCHRCFEFCPTGALSIGSKKSVTYRAVQLNELLSCLEKSED